MYPSYRHIDNILFLCEDNNIKTTKYKQNGISPAVVTTVLTLTIRVSPYKKI